MRLVIRNGAVLDTASMQFHDRHVVCEDGRIVEVTDVRPDKGDLEIDARGRYVVPGLIDAHVHFRLSTFDFRAMTGWTELEFGITMAKLATATMHRGFTTVRDLGGDVTGLIRAIGRGTIVGPRIVRAGLMISQTGGHGDAQGGRRDVPACACELRSDHFSIVADGADAVLKAARHLLRDGSDFLKVHVSGGVATPSDPLDSVQYTPAEIRAAVVEAEHRRTYVAAHAYLPESIAMAVREGVHSIEHGNLIDGPTARLLAESGAVMVPTLVTYRAMQDYGSRLGFPKTNLDKNRIVLESGIESLETAAAAGVTLGYGTDLIGESQEMQNQELAIRAEVERPEAILRSMWQVNPRLCRMEGLIGVITPGAHADLVVSTVDPLEQLRAFADHERSITHVVKGGVVALDRS